MVSSLPGYWMPFEAAKAIAATFCWEIRYLLTPLFSLDFPEMCIPPTDRVNFGRMVIDPNIVNEAAETARRYRLLEPRSYDEMSTTSFPSHALGKEVDYPSQDMRAPHIPNKYARRNYADSISSARGSSSEPYCGSPQSPTHRGFLPINRPPSSHPVTRTPHESFNKATERRKRVMKATGDGSDSETEFSSTSRSDLHPKPVFPIHYRDERVSADGDSETGQSELTSSGDESLSEDEGDEEYRGPRTRGPSSSEIACGKTGLKKNPSRSAKAKNGEKGPRSCRFAKEVKAAHALLHLHMQQASSKNEDDDEIMEDAMFGPLLGCFGSGDKKRRRASL
jgi:hypothetical protein